MLIPSIDILNGRAVQLVGGDPSRVRVDAGDPLDVAERLSLLGELAVIDLDAALSRGDNRAVILDLVRRYPARVGGGIRTVDTALDWLDAGAERVILGTAAREDVLSRLPRDRVIAALDARHDRVVVEGWREETGSGVPERMAALRGLVGGFLVTFVELEGRMGGTDLERAGAIVRAAGDARVTIAGGVTAPREVAALDELGADAQVGMALYTGALDPGEALGAMLRSDRPDGLWATIVCDEAGRALGLAYSSLESLSAAIRDGRGVYHSRSRGGLWRKGETSGDTQRLLRVDLDCDRDALRFVVRQGGGGFCHTGSRTCFGAGRGVHELACRLRDARTSGDPRSYTARLLRDPRLLASKLREEAGELAEARTHAEIVHEAADVLFFTLTSLERAGVGLNEVERELDRRALRTRRRRGDAKPGSPIPAPGPRGGLLALASPEELLAARACDEAGDDAEIVAAGIIGDVRTGGEAALRAHARRLDGLAHGGPLLLGKNELARALDAIDPPDRAALERAAERIERFARAQLACLLPLVVDVPGGQAGHEIAPVERAGCYAPGGRFPLPSSVLMTAITARVAGVREVIVASPRPAPATLAAAAIAGADGLAPVGGAQAIAALALGAGPIPACDAVVGPGNRYVTAAKRLLSGRVRIDMLAGPSELVVLADGSADAGLAALDLLAQAEHDPDARVALVTTSPELVDGVRAALATELATLPTAAVARASLAHARAVVIASLDEGIALVDRLAPEHLEVMTRDAEEVARRCAHYGAIFIGGRAAEVLGDYGIGPNHTLPTGGAARRAGGLSVLDFLRTRTWLRVDDGAGARGAFLDAARLARLEGLEAHARAALARAGG